MKSLKHIALTGLVLGLVACQNDNEEGGVNEAEETEVINESNVNEDNHDHDHDDDHDHDHDHGHEMTEEEKDVYNGYFDDENVEDRELSDWEGDWQSVYPYLQDGTLDEVMAHKAEHGDKTKEEYQSYYETGYQTDVNNIYIHGNDITFSQPSETHTATYEYYTKEILEYEKGNRGVRFAFKKVDGDEAAPTYIQFSDHAIAPKETDHFHIYMGEDHEAMLEEMEHWPTYYKDDLSGEEIAHEMMHH